ncbi:hypothetical protein B0A48_01415 [Cryoendolithus antarcticus]|uniref:Rhomboid-type serine protease n=1 Tax=Cryoendolithus antarcticus TaxID=1507870 RepID=A0A1V8TTA4_9PEZI|nr:hypothetical protein B0A48_01415 [Cryoendolithus antarcticus]
MAANNYYHDPYTRNDYNNTAYSNDWRADSSSRPQPSTSPFDDRQYGYSRNPSQSSDGVHQYPSNPFDERNTIPLDRRQKKHDSTASVAPILEPPPHDDPFVRDAKSGRSRRRDRWFKGKVTYVCFVLTVVQLVVFIAELIKNGILTKTPIEIHPSFNPMIGPSPYLLINMGARYVPCMHNMPNVQNASLEIMWPCPNATATTGDSVSCSLSDLCGFSGVPNPHVGGSVTDSPAPNQWWRFIVPIFLHAGIIHIGFNLLLQMTLGRDVEQLIGSVRFALVYFAAGIFGFVLGGNFAATGIASCGCSGSLFGILAITLLDLLYTWSERKSPIKDLLFIVLDVCIAFVLGLLPGLDNFSHIGGFCMGLVLGICILRSPTTIARRTSLHNPSYSGVTTRHATADADEGLRGFIKQPLQFFQDRRGVWWAWWAVRAFCLIGALVGFILLLKNFYVWRTGCGWCKYLSCLPIKTGGTDWCNVGNLDFTPTSTGNGTSRRDLFGMGLDGVGRML